MSLASMRRDNAAARADNAAPNEHPCPGCARMTARGTLSDFGGWCYGCYAAHCRASLRSDNEGSDLPAIQRGGVSWAHRLKAREERGDRLTQFQRQEWREALADRQPAEAGA